VREATTDTAASCTPGSAPTVAYVLIGGHAALLHGSGTATIDIDISARPDNHQPGQSQQRSRISMPGSALLIPTDFRSARQPNSLQGVSTLNLATCFGDLDLALSPAGFSAGFESLREGATAMTIAGLTVLVASLDDVIASKEAAGRDKDFEALPQLIRLRRQQQKPEGRG
jgi:hypothetical protein